MKRQITGPQEPHGHDGINGQDGTVGQKGDKGEQGERGAPGPQSGGVIYTRWGRKDCPNTTNATLVYFGRVVGEHYTNTGGGANYLCLPEDDPEFSMLVRMVTVPIYMGLNIISQLFLLCHTAKTLRVQYVIHQQKSFKL